MKDYYSVLGVPQGATQEDIKKAFRRLALQHHPDRNPGNEKQAEATFKEINEAYGIVGDAARRQQYDQYRKSPFAHAGSSRHAYDQEQVFRNSFSDPAFFSDLDRVFREAGLRFDPQFVNSVFGGKGFSFKVYTWPPQSAPTDFKGSGQSVATPRKPGLGLRFFSWVARVMLKKITGVDLLPPRGRDLKTETVISRSEAESGGEKEIAYMRGNAVKRLMVKIPAGTKNGTRIRLKGMGTEGQVPGDLYVMVKVRR